MTPAPRVRQPWERAADRLEQYASSARDEQRQAEKSYRRSTKRKSAGLTPREEQRQADIGDGPKDVFSRLADAHFFTGCTAPRDAPVERVMGAEGRGWDSSVSIMKGSARGRPRTRRRLTAQQRPGRPRRRRAAAGAAVDSEKSDREAMPPPPAPPREPRPVGGRSARNRFAVDTTESEGSGGEHEIDALVGVAPRMARGGGEVPKVSVSLDPQRRRRSEVRLATLGARRR